MTDPTEDRPELSFPRDNPKVQQIIKGAREMFLERGYGGTSVDAIARQAGVSKATLYHYFDDKAALFAAFVDHEGLENARRTMAAIEHSEGPIDENLRQVARNMVRFLTSEFARKVLLVVIGESPRFPELGRAFYQSGPATFQRQMATQLATAAKRGELNIEDPVLAAKQFGGLCRSDLFERLLFGAGKDFNEEQIARHADNAVSAFMRIYGP